MSKKGGLGKGLGAIFGENTSPAVEKAQEPASAAQELLIKNIAANRISRAATLMKKSCRSWLLLLRSLALFSR